MPANDALTFEEAKEYLTLDGTEGDSKLKLFISAITARLERKLGTAFVRRSFTEEQPGLVKRIYLDVAPIVSVTSITDPAGYTVPATDYVVRYGRYLEHWGRFWQAQTAAGQPTNWTIVYTAGWFADVKAVDPAVKLEVVRVIEAILTNPDPRISNTSVGDLSVGYGNAASGTAPIDPLLDESMRTLANYMGRAL